MATRIRPVEEEDLPELTRIYNHYIVETPITFDVEPYTVEKRRAWLEGFDRESPYRCFVAEVDGRAAGWACTLRFRPKAAYDLSVETSIYLDPAVTGQGLGTQLYETLFASLAGAGLHRALGGITLPNPASVALHERFGFERVGVFPEVGFKLGRYWDVIWLSKDLSHQGTIAP
jgi:phosphinothricin acetyltransferase